MGVTGLLQCLKEIQEPVSLKKYKGKTLAIDTYGWLHRGLVSCAQELCLDIPTRKYISSIMKKVKMLEDFGVRPYFVFDGALLPAKAETANERRMRREEARRKAEEYQKKGNRKAAWKEFMKAACVTPEMAKSIMVELDKLHIDYIVAPYEADPQMVYLEKIGLVDGILSEDSDLLIFGCNKLITKLKDDATCVEICRDNFSKVRSIPNLAQYTQEQLRLVAMLAGCDYTKGIPSVGLKTAFNLVEKHSNLDQIILALKADGKIPPEDFMDEVFRANLAFQYQKVFNPLEKALKTLNEYPEKLQVDFDTLELCCGETHSDEIHFEIANGTLHPRSHTLLVSREHGVTGFKSNSFSASIQKTTNSLDVSSSVKESSLSVKMDAKSKSIDSYFHVSSDVTRRKTGTINKRGQQVPSLSPASKKVQKMIQANKTQNGTISRFFGETSQTIETTSESLTTSHSPTRKDVWDNSMISGESDFPDEFSSPSKKVGIFKNHSKSTTDLSGSNSRSLTNVRIPQISPRKKVDSTPTTDLRSSPYKSLNFTDDDNEIEESPVKKVETEPTSDNSDKLSNFAKELRKNFSNNDSGVVRSRPASLANRKPLAPKTLNKRSGSGKLGGKTSKKLKSTGNVPEKVSTIAASVPSTSLSKFSYSGST